MIKVGDGVWTPAGMATVTRIQYLPQIRYWVMPAVGVPTFYMEHEVISMDSNIERLFEEAKEKAYWKQVVTDLASQGNEYAIKKVEEWTT